MIEDLLLFAAISIIAFLLTWALTGAFIPFLIGRKIFDVPNERSSHETPVPRGGGLVLCAVIIGCVTPIAWLTGTEPLFIWLLAGLAFVIGISWFDDLYVMSAKLRICIHLLAVLCGLQALPQGLILGGLMPGWMETIFIVIGWLWFINLFNFMDGIDGMAGSGAAFMALSVAVLTVLALPDTPYLFWVSAVIFGASMGYLNWNWHPARIFMGDVGSVPLGYVVGFLLICAARKGLIVAAFIPAMYFVVDTTYTLIKRVCRGEKFWHSHHEFFFHRALTGLENRHDRVMYRVLTAYAGLFIAMLSYFYIGVWALLPATVIIVALCAHLSRLEKKSA